MPTFPNEQPISQHDLITAAQSNLFEEFDVAVSASGNNETFKDFDFTECPVQNAAPGASSVVARPRPGVNAKVWIWDMYTNEWYEDATVDAAGQVLGPTGQPVYVPPPPVAPQAFVPRPASNPNRMTSSPNQPPAVDPEVARRIGHSGKSHKFGDMLDEILGDK